MPLNQQQVQGMFQAVVNNQGLSLQAGDRLDAFKLGIDAALKVVSNLVSLDAVPQKQQPPHLSVVPPPGDENTPEDDDTDDSAGAAETEDTSD